MAITRSSKKLSPKVTSLTKYLRTPSRLSVEDRERVIQALNGLTADAIALYLKSKNFHWHLSGRNFRDYHLLFDEQADQIFNTIDVLAERVRKLGGLTIHSIGQVARLTGIKDDDEPYVTPEDMVHRLLEDNSYMADKLAEAIEICDQARDSASSNILQTFLDETERRVWFLFEIEQNTP
jgi:starvation-inducible DNA-binding protein